MKNIHRMVTGTVIFFGFTNVAHAQSSLNQAMMDALTACDPAQVKAALNAGADPNESTWDSDVTEKYPLGVALRKCEGNQNLNSVVQTLVQAGANINVRGTMPYRYSPNTYLEEATEYEYVDQVKLLLSLGADPNAVNPSSGLTPIFYLTNYHSFTSIQAEIDINLSILNLLAEAHANLNAKERNGHTPLEYVRGLNTLVADDKNYQAALSKRMIELGAKSDLVSISTDSNRIVPDAWTDLEFFDSAAKNLIFSSGTFPGSSKDSFSYYIKNISSGAVSLLSPDMTKASAYISHISQTADGSVIAYSTGYQYTDQFHCYLIDAKTQTTNELNFNKNSLGANDLITCLISPDGKYAYAGSGYYPKLSHVIRMNLATQTVEWAIPELIPNSSYVFRSGRLQFFGDDDQVAYTYELGPYASKIILRNMKTGTQTTMLDVDAENLASQGYLLDFKFSEDRSQLIFSLSHEQVEPHFGQSIGTIFKKDLKTNQVSHITSLLMTQFSENHGDTPSDGSFCVSADFSKMVYLSESITGFNGTDGVLNIYGSFKTQVKELDLNTLQEKVLMTLDPGGTLNGKLMCSPKLEAIALDNYWLRRPAQ